MEIKECIQREPAQGGKDRIKTHTRAWLQSESSPQAVVLLRGAVILGEGEEQAGISHFFLLQLCWDLQHLIAHDFLTP